jgi:hypothetical protein
MIRAAPRGHYGQGWTHNDISSVVECSEGSGRSLYQANSRFLIAGVLGSDYRPGQMTNDIPRGQGVEPRPPTWQRLSKEGQG